MIDADPLDEVLRLTGVELPEDARAALREAEGVLGSLLPSVAALRLKSEMRSARELVPFAAVDERSYACVVGRVAGNAAPDDLGSVVRWHLAAIDPHEQRAPLDVSVRAYLKTAETEERFRETGLRRMVEIAEAFEASHAIRVIESEETDDRADAVRRSPRVAMRLPRAHESRPIRIACQNVVIGLASYRYDATFDGLSASVWQTCQAPHLATHEGNRALLALTLAEAFRTGGTMEVRFDDHPEGRIPVSLRQYARTRGIDVGRSDAASLAPGESRDLLLAVTPMSPQLREQVQTVVNAGALSPERVCYLLLAGTWSAIELEFLLAVTDRAPSILNGGVTSAHRVVRRSELAVCRATVMAGVLAARLRRHEPAAGGNREAASVIEDAARPIEWSVMSGHAAIRFDGVAPGTLPWDAEAAVRLEPGQPLIVVPRDRTTQDQLEIAAELAARGDALVATLEPRDAPQTRLTAPRGVCRLVAPDRTPALDGTIEGRLSAARVGRAA